MKLIDPSGEVRLGLLEEPIEAINHEDYALLTPMGRRAGWLQRRLGFNRFDFMGALSDELVLGAAVVDVRYVSAGFAYVTNLETGRTVTVSQRLPLGLGATMSASPESGVSAFSGMGVRIEQSALGNTRRLVIQSRKLSAELTFSEGQLAPLRLCTRAGASGWTFTRKAAGHSVQGWISLNGRRRTFGAEDGLRGLHDWSAGYMRRETFWNWAAAAGTLRDGRVLGLNLSCGVNETSFSENALWLDGTQHRLPPVHFACDRRDLMKPWRVFDQQGRVSLSFTPIKTAHKERVSALIVASNFAQICGKYTGRLETASGEVVAVEGMTGLAEWHYARW